VDSDNPPVRGELVGALGLLVPARRRPFPGVTARRSAAPERIC